MNKIKNRFFYGPVALAILTAVASCSTGSAIHSSAKNLQKEGITNDDRLGYLLLLRENCKKEKKNETETKECDRNIDGEIESIVKKYRDKKHEEIVILPPSTIKGGLKAQYRREFAGYDSSYNESSRSVSSRAKYVSVPTGNYYTCGRIYNLGNKVIEAIQFDVNLYDGFNKQMGSVSIQKNVSIKPNDPDINQTTTWFHGMIYVIPLIWPVVEEAPRNESNSNNLICSSDSIRVDKGKFSQVKYTVNKIKFK